MILYLFRTVCLVILFLHAVPVYADIPADRILAEINLARTNPRVYADFLREFRGKFQGKKFSLGDDGPLFVTKEGVKAIDEAIRFLMHQKPLTPLTWSTGLAAAAADLVNEQAITGEIGHEGFESGGIRFRIERYGDWYGEIGENIDYGPREARLAVMQLIINDGVPNRGHRRNTFNRNFKTAGVSCGSHPRFGNMCVIDFAQSFRESN